MKSFAHKYVALGAILLVSALAPAQVPVTGVTGARIQDLVGSPTLVTVVLKNGPKDVNLQVVDLGPDYVSVKLQDGSRTAYKFAAIAEIQVQGDRIEAKEFRLSRTRALTSEEQKLHDRAIERAKQIFDTPGTDQSLRMSAASLLALTNDRAAIEYLEQFLTGNDTATAVEAAFALYLAGTTPPNMDAILSLGIGSGNREIRSKAVILAGLLGDESQVPKLMQMLRDRLADYSVPAMIALALLNEQDALPMLYENIQDSNKAKGDAAVIALSRMQSDEIAPRLKEIYPRTQNFSQFRIAKTLYAHNDTLGRQLLQDEFLDSPPLAIETAIALAKNGDRDGIRVLNAKLAERFNPTQPVELITRAEVAMALVVGGDGNATIAVQDLLTVEFPDVVAHTCRLIADAGLRRLMPLTQTAVEHTDPKVALAACVATLACANPDFHDRLAGVRLVQ